MTIPRFFARQTVLVNMLMLAILAAGIIALNRMPQEANPSVDMDSVLLIIPYASAAPEDVEKLITLPISDQIENLPDVDYIWASSKEGRSVFFIQYEVGLDDFDAAIMDLKNEVDKVKNQLPDDAADDMFYIKISSNEIWPVMSIALGGDYSVEGLNDIAENIKDILTDVEDVAKVEVHGVRKREIWVEIDRSKLLSYGLSITEVSNSIKYANINLPAGRVEFGNEEFIVRAMGEVNSPKEIGNIVLRAGSDGASVALKDIALINDTYEKDNVITRLNSVPSIHIRIYKTREGSVVDIAKIVREKIKEYENNVPDITISIRHDSSIEVKDSLSALASNAMSGLILVALLMTLTIGFRSAVFAIIGIPFAFLTAFIFLYASDNTINTLSLFAIILVLGMIVDDAIIIIENVYRHMEEGKPPLKAAIEGTEQVMWPVISAVLTTIAAFLPLLMMTGVMGKFLMVLPIVVTLALVGSLIQSLVVLPSHLADFGRMPKVSTERKRDKVISGLRTIYEKQVSLFLDHKYIVTIGIFIVTVLSIMLASNVLRIEMFADEPATTERMIVKLPTGTKLQETNRILEEIEKRVSHISKKEIKSYSSMVGLVIENKQWIFRTSGGMMVFEMGESEDRRTNDELKDEIRKLIKDIPEISTAYFTKGDHGPPTGEPIELRVLGENLDRLLGLAEMIADDLKDKNGIKDVRVHHDPGKKELRFIPDRIKMSTYGMDMTSLVVTMRSVVEGWEATKFRDKKGDEVRVVVMYMESDRNTVEDMNNMIINTPKGIAVPLSELGQFVIKRGAANITRYNGKRSITVTANVNNKDINSEEANRFIREKHKNFSQLYPGFSLDFGGEADEMQKSFTSLLQAFFVALIIIYLILGTQFQSFLQPLVVMFTVPFSILGVAIGLIVMDLSFSLVAGISVVALSGVVVNDSLVLVDFINKARATGLNRREALVRSGSQRMRPILLTTITTIAGLIPMAMSWGGTSVVWKPMAICMIWGLAFATFLTLFIVPCAYAILDDWQNFFRRHLKMKSTDQALIEKAEELRAANIMKEM